ncbi:MAG: glutamate synthase subunit beta [Gammaproteobacteria bacterium]|nr:glutamate synthase subunit beta [Gammaproteobacteria bacterium]
MGKPTGFVEINRQSRSYRPVADRIRHFGEFVIQPEDSEIRKQGARCMDCGIPFCHHGCPLDNIIPDWNDLVYKDNWRTALDVLHATNNFPEFTGRVCPAPCETSCTLNLSGDPVTIKSIECAIIDKGWEEGWIKPQIPKHRSGKKVVIVGSGPAGLACAQQLARAGHAVCVMEKNPGIGGLLRFGIPNFKLDKSNIDKRMSQLQAEGVKFLPGVHVGKDVSIDKLKNEFNAIILAGGSEQPRDLDVPGRELDGVHFAMDYLSQQNKRLAGIKIPETDNIVATDKRVVVIGGGDTGSDCVGTAIRQGARWVRQIEIMPKPPEQEDRQLNWPNWPNTLMTSTSHEEGCRRNWGILTKAFQGNEGRVKSIDSNQVNWAIDKAGKMAMSEDHDAGIIPIKADLVLLAMGFVHPVHEGLLADLKVKLDQRGNVKADGSDYKTSVENVFVAGDMRRGQSLIVWAIREGRQCARAVDKFLMGSTALME